MAEDLVTEDVLRLGIAAADFAYGDEVKRIVEAVAPLIRRAALEEAATGAETEAHGLEDAARRHRRDEGGRPCCICDGMLKKARHLQNLAAAIRALAEKQP